MYSKLFIDAIDSDESYNGNEWNIDCICTHTWENQYDVASTPLDKSELKCKFNENLR